MPIHRSESMTTLTGVDQDMIIGKLLVQSLDRRPQDAFATAARIAVWMEECHNPSAMIDRFLHAISPTLLDQIDLQIDEEEDEKDKNQRDDEAHHGGDVCVYVYRLSVCLSTTRPAWVEIVAPVNTSSPLLCHIIFTTHRLVKRPCCDTHSRLAQFPKQCKVLVW